MKFINDTGLNYLVQKINSIFRINNSNDIVHTDLNVRKLDAQKIDIDGATRIETSNNRIKLGNTLTNISQTNTSVLSILGDEVTVKRSLDSHNIKSKWISRHNDLGSLSLGYNSNISYPHIKIYNNKLTLSGGTTGIGSQTSPFITIDKTYDKIKLTSGDLGVHSGNIVIYNKLSIRDYLNVETSNMYFKTSNYSIGMYTDSNMNDADLDGEKIRLDSNGNITLCGRDNIRMGISQTLNVTPAMSTFYETIVTHYGIDYRWLHLTCPNSFVSLQLETDKAYYTKTNAVRTANDEIATIGDITSRIQESDAMQYKGSINASADLPTVSNTINNVKVGATYKVATAGTYSYYNGTSTVSQSAKVGDLFIAQAVASGATKTITWDYIPAADDVLALSYITSGTPTISTTAQTGTSLTLGSAVTKMFETTLTNTDANVPTSKAVQTYVSGVTGGYIPNGGNSRGESFILVRDDMTFKTSEFSVTTESNEQRIFADGDGVEITGTNSNTMIAVGSGNYNIDDVEIHAEDGQVTFVTDNINLQAAASGVTLGGDTTDLTIYTGNLTLESTGITSIKSTDEVTIVAPDTNTPALSFGTDFDVHWFNRSAVITVYGNAINDWNTFVNNILTISGVTTFVFEITDKPIIVASNTTIENSNNTADYENTLKFVNCRFDITNSNVAISITGGRVEFENCRFVAPSYVNNKVILTDTPYAVFKNCTFENVNIECTIDTNSGTFYVENCYCSHNLNLAPVTNPTAPIKVFNSYFDTATITTPTGQTDVNAIIAGCRFSPNTSLSNVRRSWNNTLY